MGHDHHHHKHGLEVSRKLLLSAIATLAFVIIELAAGLFSNSLALIGGALHDFTDSLALLLALFAVRIAQRPASGQKTYGYHRAGILAAFVNAGTLVAFTIYIFVEAFERFRNPPAVNELPMVVTAVVGLVLNTVITLSLRREGKDDVNIRSAVVHMIGDAVSSVGIIIAASLIAVTGSALWDPAISILIGVMILWSSWGILKETVNLLLEGTPRGIDPTLVSQSISAIDGVYGVHHLHIWALGPSLPALSCHIMVGDVPVKTTAGLLAEVNATLERDHHIVHTTIQFEFASCSVDDPYCIPYTARG
jgi:cobalt-zinc-cadmium efflux system protein